MEEKRRRFEAVWWAHVILKGRSYLGLVILHVSNEVFHFSFSFCFFFFFHIIMRALIRHVWQAQKWERNFRFHPKKITFGKYSCMKEKVLLAPFFRQILPCSARLILWRYCFTARLIRSGRTEHSILVQAFYYLFGQISHFTISTICSAHASSFQSLDPTPSQVLNRHNFRSKLGPNAKV